MSEYKIMKDECGNTVECDICYSKVPVCMFDDSGLGGRNLCEICSHTVPGSVMPGDERMAILRSINFVGNKILEEIRNQA